MPEWDTKQEDYSQMCNYGHGCEHRVPRVQRGQRHRGNVQYCHSPTRRRTCHIFRPVAESSRTVRTSRTGPETGRVNKAGIPAWVADNRCNSDGRLARLGRNPYRLCNRIANLSRDSMTHIDLGAYACSRHCRPPRVRRWGELVEAEGWQ